jgi:hypothetical protein
MTARVTVWWSPGEPEDDMHGFVTKKGRDAYMRGEPGPFERVVRNHHELGPITPERHALLDLFKKWENR